MKEILILRVVHRTSGWWFNEKKKISFLELQKKKKEKNKGKLKAIKENIDMMVISYFIYKK